jgi:hypothetical protein
MQLTTSSMPAAHPRFAGSSILGATYGIHVEVISITVHLLVLLLV